MNFRRFTSPDTARRVLRIFVDIYRTERPRSAIEIEIINKDKARRFIELSASLIYDVEGAPCGYRGIGRDVTDRMKEEKERRRLTEHLQRAQRLEALGRLAGGIAHDFNNLLMGIQGNASLMLSALDTTDANIENVRCIERCVRSGANLTRQLLGYARGGKYMVKPTNLNELIKKTAEMFGRTRKEIQVVASYQEDVWTVAVDRIQIEQVLVNIYLNGYQAMAQKGVLHLKTENIYLDEAFVKPHNVTSGPYVKISVKDSGTGMNQDVQTHVFEPFFTTKPVGSGTGLGLASAFGIVKNHLGIIDFVSRPTKGTTFFVYLPVTGQPLHSEAETGESLHGGSETILIIDDEQYILDACKAMLEDMGYLILTALGGEEGVGIFRQQREDIDLVILDMIMPGMDGSETYQQLKAIDSGVKVLVSSGYSKSDIAAEMLAMGCDEFIQKPFDTYKVSKKIRSLLDGQSSNPKIS
jgi:signal transduction histidine kinase/CheY-like chemotaxis protein